MKKLHIIISIIWLFLASIAILVYATEYPGNWAYRIVDNNTIYQALSNTGSSLQQTLPQTHISEHTITKEITNYNCEKDIFVPTRTNTEFSDRYKKKHSCYNIIDSDPICTSTKETCSIWNPKNVVEDDDLWCGYWTCSSTQKGFWVTWYCENGAKTSNQCIEDKYKCIANENCGGAAGGGGGAK